MSLKPDPLLQFIYLLLVLFLKPPLLHANADISETAFIANTFLDFDCNRTKNYTRDDVFQQNVGHLISFMAESANSTGFLNTTFGNGASHAYGLFLCRPDVHAGRCRNCVDDARKKMMELCPEGREGVVWYSHCLLHYSDADFFGVADLSFDDYTWYLDPKVGSIATRNVKAQALAVVKQATESPNLYAFNSTLLDGDSYEHMLAQCTRDLSRSQCSTCLNKALSSGYRNYDISRTWTTYLYSCQIIAADSVFNLEAETTTISRGSKSRKIRNIVVAACSAMGTVTVLIGILGLLLRSRTSHKYVHENLRKSSFGLASLGVSDLDDEERNSELPHLSLKDIQEATRNFSKEDQLGHGGFGYVYKGELSGRTVAIKRLSQDSRQGLKEFMNEVTLIARLQHKNLVRLLGCCLERGEKLLVYEFMPNGSLDAFLKDPQKRKALDWEKRFNIIMGSARGILYLHQDSRLNVIHRDLKAGNVLLDEEMKAKISDFGMARIFNGDNEPQSTNIIVGTHGYMAPEYAMDGLFSIKSDVYSFGVLLLEIVSGQTSSRLYALEEDYGLVGYTWTMWCEGTAVDLIDPLMRGESTPPDQAMRCIHIALLCVQEDPADRPTMSTIVHMLESDSLPLSPPSRPPLVFSRAITRLINPLPDINSSSIKNVTDSVILPR